MSLVAEIHDVLEQLVHALSGLLGQSFRHRLIGPEFEHPGGPMAEVDRFGDDQNHIRTPAATEKWAESPPSSTVSRCVAPTLSL